MSESNIQFSIAEFLANHPIEKADFVPLSKIEVTFGTQPRKAMEESIIEDYEAIVRASLEDGSINPFDAIRDEDLPQLFEGDDGTLILADGFHRFAAHKRAGDGTMKCAIRSGDLESALIFCLGANANHGFRRTKEDKARAVSIALANPELSKFSNYSLAEVCVVSENMVRRHRAELAEREEEKKRAAAPKEPQKKPSKNVAKIAKAIGGQKGKQFAAAVEDGSLAIAPAEIDKMSQMEPGTIQSITPLVMGGYRMSPSKAEAFVSGSPAAKIIEDLHNRAISAGGTYVFENDAVKITAEHKGE